MRFLRRALAAFAGFLALALVALAALGARQRPVTAIPAGTRGTHVVVDGIPIRYHQAGRGRDIVLVHGSPGSIEDWDAVFDSLSARYRVTAYDRHGHGYSGGAGRPHTPAENARVATALIGALGLRDVVYVGHSYGGITGLHMATTDAANVSAYVLVGARAYPPVNVDPLYRVLSVPLLGGGFATVAAGVIGPARVEQGIRASLGPNVDRLPPGFVDLRARLWIRPTITTTLARERTTLADALREMGSRYHAVRRPVVLVCGDQDPPNYEQAHRLVREIPGARLRPLRDTGHYVQLGRPDEVIAAVDEAASLGR